MHLRSKNSYLKFPKKIFGVHPVFPRLSVGNSVAAELCCRARFCLTGSVSYQATSVIGMGGMRTLLALLAFCSMAEALGDYCDGGD